MTTQHIIENLRGLYNEYVQDEGLEDIDPRNYGEIILGILGQIDDLDNLIIAGQPLPVEWQR